MTEKPDEAQVGVVFLSTSSKKGGKLIKNISRVITAVQGLEIGSQWEDLDGEELVYQLSRYTHLVLVFDAALIGSRWLGYLSGFTAGAGIPLYFMYTSSESLPGYLKTIKIFADESDLISTLQEDFEDYSIFRRVEDAREELIGRGYGLKESIMAEACAAGEQDVVELFLILGYSPDSSDNADVVLLNFAVRGGHEKIVVMLLEHGADPNILSGDRGNTPLMDAASLRMHKMVGLLLAAGADPDHQSKNGQTALMMAIGENDDKTVELLVKNGASLEISDQLGMTAIKYANLFKNQTIVTLVSE